MAPSFFSKLVKPTGNQASPTHSRDSSYEFSASNSIPSLKASSRPSRSQTISVVGSNNGVEHATNFGVLSLNARKTTSGRGENKEDRGYMSDTVSPTSPAPSLHIVPPSPMFPEASPRQEFADGTLSTETTPRRLSSSSVHSKVAVHDVPRLSKSRPASPVSAPTITVSPSNSAAEDRLLKLQPEMRHKSSAKSLRHIITSSPPSNTSSNPISNGQMVESPTSLETEFVFAEGPGKEDETTPRDEGAISPPPRGNSPASPSSPSSPSNSPTAQPARPGSGWRKAISKPTGLAGAIAASGMVLANPNVSAQISPPRPGEMQRTSSSSTLLPPQMLRNQSSSSKRSFTYVGPESVNGSASNTSSSKKKKEKEKDRKQRNNTVDPSKLPDLDLHDGDYYAGLNSQSESEEATTDSDDEHILGRRPRSRGGRSLNAGNSDRSRSRSNLGSAEVSPARAGVSGRGPGWKPDGGLVGYAVASNRRNVEFHEMFPMIAENEYLLEDYGCALQKELLIQGRLYISEGHILFYANILGWITSIVVPIHEIVSVEKKMTAFVIPNALQISTRQARYNFTSFLTRDTTYSLIMHVSKIHIGPTSPSPDETSIDGALVATGAAAAEKVGGVAAVPPKRTACTCSNDGGHYAETALDIVIPGTPDKIHDLMFNGNFIKDFMSTEQKLTDIQISDWTPASPAKPGLHARDMSYIKPLNAPVGPKSTKCEIRDEVVHCDFDDHATTISTTKTPDVPSGGSFSVKTRTCIMWHTAASSRIVVTTQVDWTGRSFLKGIIERSAIDGQKTQYTELERAMRAHIQENQSDFLPAGVDLAAAEPLVTPQEALVELSSNANTFVSSASKTPHQSPGWFQMALDMFISLGKGAFGLMQDAREQSGTNAVLCFVIVGLLMTNMWTYFAASKAGRKELVELRELRRQLRERTLPTYVSVPDKGRSGELEQSEREKWIHGIVSALKEEMKPVDPVLVTSPPMLDEGGQVIKENLQQSVAALMKTLENVDERVKVLKRALKRPESADNLD